MIKKELLGIWYSTKSRIFIGLIIFLPLIDLLQIFFNSNTWDYLMHKEAYSYHLNREDVMNPALAGVLSGSSEGFLIQMIWIWLLPLFLLILYSDSYITEQKKGYSSIVLTRTSRKTYFHVKMFVSFIVPFTLYFSALLLNFLLSCLIFHGGKYFKGLDYSLTGESSYFVFQIMHPYLTYGIYIVVFSFCAGLCGIMCQGLTFLMKSHKLAYFTAFVIWFILICLKYSLTYLFQPFIEYGPDYVIPAAIQFLIPVAVIFILSYRTRVMCNEL